ncbi:MAG TPA: alpha/beta hydrolase [Anaerolineaceae bacterium]|nr:alpha/beta hydrolase [Anaerolineaceae bacterium]
MIETTKSYMNLGDGQLYYETAGAGMPLVFSHAAFLDSRMFDAVWEPLAKHFRVIRYDMRGFGKSSPVTGPLCRRTDLLQLLNHLDVTDAHLVGCSNGGQLSLDLALEQPQRVASLTLVGSTPSGFELRGEPPRHLFEMFDAMQQGDNDLSNELQIRIWLDGEHREPQQVDSALRKKALEMNRIPVSQSTFFIADTQPVNPLDPPAIARLESVKCPALVIAGALDHSEVLRAANEMAERIPNARKALIESAGHVPGYEQPDRFVKLLLDFLGSKGV